MTQDKLETLTEKITGLLDGELVTDCMHYLAIVEAYIVHKAGIEDNCADSLFEAIDSDVRRYFREYRECEPKEAGKSSID
jgi:hypothetical protein